ncbi:MULTISPECIES: AMP-binding protein [unclassified Parafrankia]|uniref:AMP-binding protein n=1 Tax=unclassified Parafrankia TaxID=2994368 RepID=UPI000DA5454B|nr:MULTISPECIES: AMP-binding protein [unclassified Parafrankia]TCJ31675.1 fatty acyl-AMP ligase [Parafrankia sp. BMG5.11]SQD95967.1 AMP-dependent synthetase and ligase [Parafrankia sp. Ea1.12]
MHDAPAEVAIPAPRAVPVSSPAVSSPVNLVPADSVPADSVAAGSTAAAALAAGTLHAGLATVAARHPGLPLDFPSAGASLTLGELVARADVLAAALTGAGTGGAAGAGVVARDRVGVLSDNAPDFLVALAGVSRAGAAACPLPLPASTRDLPGYAARLARAVAVAGIRLVLVGGRTARMADRFAGAFDGVRLVRVADLTTPAAAGTVPATGTAPAAAGGAAPAGPAVEVSPDEAALVQFTSGSTAAPKGVVLTHRNILAGLTAIIDGVALTEADHGGIWLPLFHDMGLFGTLAGIFTGMPMTVWSPAAFVKDPAGWLTDFLGRGGSIAPMPNFAYDHLAEAVPAPREAGLDLSGWRVAFNGAEPVEPASVERFLTTFTPAGFAPAAMMPVYGMAEATLAVTFPPPGRAPVHRWVDRDLLARDGVARDVPAGSPSARGLAGVGRPVRAMRVRIGGRDGTGVLGDDQVGEIQISGDAVTGGYLTDTGAQSAGAFTADGWLRTGDLGLLRDGELFVTGRDKEMVIVRGVNYYPHDAEEAARDVPGVHRRRCVAYADRSPEGAETMAILAETRLVDDTERAALAAAIRVAVTAALGLAEIAVALVGPDALPRTSSGKFQRLAAREACVPT